MPVESWPARFSELGLQISTGPVVMFRARKFLLNEPANSSSVPLLSAHTVRPFTTQWPVDKKKWPTAFSDVPESRKHLVPNRNYVLLKRFSSKEEPRRLTASCLLQGQFRYPRLALENHLNYIYHIERELTAAEVYGIAGVFNSILFDRYFRTFSGNTQVNATEIRTVKFPELSRIVRIGNRLESLRNPTLAIADRIVVEELGIDAALFTYLQERGE